VADFLHALGLLNPRPRPQARIAVTKPSRLTLSGNQDTADQATRLTTRKDSVNNCGEPLNRPFNIMVTVHAKLNFGRINPDLEQPERSRAAR
jgi:hypothetical protein